MSECHGAAMMSGLPCVLLFVSGRVASVQRGAVPMLLPGVFFAISWRVLSTRPPFTKCAPTRAFAREGVLPGAAAVQPFSVALS